MLSRGEVKQIIVLPESETAIIHLYPGAIIKGNPVKVKVYSGLAIQKWNDSILAALPCEEMVSER